MARGTTLANLLIMLKAELGYALESGVAVAEDTRLKYLLAYHQSWLAGEYDWPFLKRTGDVLVASGDRTATLPATLDWNRPVQANVLNKQIWLPLHYGISAQDLIIWNSDDGKKADPIIKWQYASDTTFEMWPRPATATTIRFAGMKVIGALSADSDTADLDDLLIVLFASADICAGQSKPDAAAKLARAQKRLASLTASHPKPYQSFKLGGGKGDRSDKDYMGGTISGGSLANTAGGTVPLAAGVSSGSVSFSLAATPVAVVLQVQAPAGGSVITATLNGAATALGFSFNLSGATDSTGYSLVWEATLS